MHLIYNSDDLISLVSNLKKAGYEPAINFDCGWITNIRLELHGIYCVIATQQMTTTCMHVVITVASKDIFNNVNVAMNQFNMILFILKQRSSYTRQDPDILFRHTEKTPAHIRLFE